ncbi:amino acid adenylation domain-containing protein [Nonomuraea sp. NN258]|uniref:non-ribosomal peptide synthetase n=1 Tax=Nonomuraea antri TaxID=2730852 RepID=UPI00156A473B|nr:non-ribosomal peptide synthetase [Nonomuraea antri]NRQ32610.1 amino acid adenylation domain-containing protein [Nonomuraea antri]
MNLARTLPGLILEQAGRRPAAPAVRQWGRTLSYAALAGGARALAAELRARGVRPEHRVGVCLRRTPSLVTGVLGVLLSGGAYVPLDPDGPAARRAEIIRDAGIDVVVADEDTAALFTDPVLVDQIGHQAGETECPAQPENLAYVLYTSGSTGRPKGVMVSHHSLLSYALAFGAFTGADEDTRSFGFAALGFDVSVLDLFVPLAAGGCVQLAGEADRADPARLQRFAAEHEVTWGCLPVALLPLLDPAALPAWRTVITGAEAPGPEQVERWSAAGRRFLNCYGPTEATVCVTAFEASGRWERPLPIGRALAGHRAYVVDDELRPVAAGVPGELLIGGFGLARGYLGAPGLTAERFLPDPWGEPGGRLYRTGDLVVRDEDGELTFLGRTDRQVKIRGQRVEIGEVETVLRAHHQVGHAVVEAVEGRDGTRLVAFCAPGAADDPLAPGDVAADDLLAHCAQRLPAAMIPDQVVMLPSLPLLPSGKVDGRALRALLPDRPASAGPAPESTLERQVAAVWAGVLGVPVDKVGMDDDFFASGGHSISAMRLVSAIRSELDRPLAAEDVFAGRTVAGIVAAIERSAPGAEPLPHGSPPALSAAQHRLWFVDRLAPDSAAYNIALAERLRGPLDVEALRAALAAVAARHDVLRWRVPDARGVPYVEVDPPGPVPLPIDDLSQTDLSRDDLSRDGLSQDGGREERLRQVLAAEAAHRFDLARGPLWQARLIRLADTDHVLALTFHHAVFDGWSQRPFLDDLARAYRDPALGHPDAGFADYVVWRAGRDARRGSADLAWWQEHLTGVPATLDLPADRPRPPVQTYTGAMTGTALPAEVSAAVRALAATLGTTAPTVLLAAFGEVLRRVTGRDDLVIGTPAADRRHDAFHDLVGFFVEVVPLRLRMERGQSFAARVRECAEEFLAVLAHPGATLERMVEALALPRDPSRAPLVQVLFNVYNFPEPHLDLPGVTAERVEPGLAGSPFDLTLYVAERDGGYAIDCVYNPDLFAAERIEALLAAYTTLIGEAAKAPERPVAEHPMAALPALAAGVSQAPAPIRPVAATTGGASPATATEHLVAGVWREVLGRDAVGATDNFFDVGGTSLTLVIVQDRLAELTGRRLPVVELFQHTTVRALAGHLDGDTGRPTLNRADQRAEARRQRTDQRRKRGRQ